MGYLFAIALISLAIVPARAAEIAIKGRVVGETQTPVAGVRVRFSPHGTPEAVSSDADGEFEVKIPSLGHYLVQASHDQFFPLRDHPVEIVDERELLIVLNHQRELFQSAKVTDDQPEVDLDRNPTQRSLSGTEILDVPVPKDRYLRNSFRLIPGAVQDNHGGIHFAGGAENQVLYTLDGFNIGDPVTGAFDTRLSPDAVRSLEYSSGSPDAGRGSAGTVAIETKMGDDKVRYTATNFLPGLDEHKGLRLGTWAPRLGASGPFKRGRAWFSETFDMQFLPLVVQDLPKGQDTATTWQSGSFKNSPVFPGPCMPQPTTPSVIRFEGAARFSAPQLRVEIIVGPAAAASPVVARKWRRFIPEEGLCVCFFIMLPSKHHLLIAGQQKNRPLPTRQTQERQARGRRGRNRMGNWQENWG